MRLVVLLSVHPPPEAQNQMQGRFFLQLSDTNMCCRPQQNVQCIFLRRRRSHLRWILGNGLRYMICSAAHIASDACRLSEGSAWAGAGLATFLMIMKWLTFENSPIQAIIRGRYINRHPDHSMLCIYRTNYI